MSLSVLAIGGHAQTIPISPLSIPGDTGEDLGTRWTQNVMVLVFLFKWHLDTMKNSESLGRNTHASLYYWTKSHLKTSSFTLLFLNPRILLIHQFADCS